MEIPKYINTEPGLEEKLRQNYYFHRRVQIDGTPFYRGRILKLTNPEGILKSYKVKNIFVHSNIKLSLNTNELHTNEEYSFILTYDTSTDKITIVDPITNKEYIIGDINPEWMKLQLAKKKLAFAMSLNERLGEYSVLKDVPFDIINCIVDKVDSLKVDSPKVDSPKVDSPKVDPPKEELGGGGVRLKKKKRKTIKKKKTRRRKSKRKKHKTKRRK